MEKITLTSDTSGLRLDVFLSRRFPAFSRSFFQRLIGAEKVTVNGRAVVPHFQVKEGDVIEGELAEETRELLAEDIPFAIIYEDDDLMVINKGPGVVVHPAAGHWTGTLLNALAGYARGKFTPFLVHRLDKDTSGLLLVAKNERAKNSLMKQFQHRAVKKVYLAAVAGCVNEAKGRIEAPLGRSPDDRKTMAVGPRATKMAVTEFSVVKRAADYSLLEVYPVTGRTHQIRSHMVFIGHPVLGDTAYGGPSSAGGFDFRRQMLHAYKISFTHPGTAPRPMSFTAPLPDDMVALWGNSHRKGC